MELRSDRAVARIDLVGGRLASLVIDGMEVLLTSGEKPTRWGSFPMAPWAGRLADGVLQFEGATHRFPITSAPHANHGRSHLQQWWKVPARENTLRTDLVAPWPFGGHVFQTFTLDDQQFEVTIEVHAGNAPMPATVGWHPWYRRQLDRGDEAQLEFAAGAVYELDEHLIPTGELVAVPPAPWNETFVQVTQQPVITWPGALRLELLSTFDHWVVFTEPDHALAIEPQSGPPNQLNRNPHIVRPGEPLIGSMTLRWASPDQSTV